MLIWFCTSAPPPLVCPIRVRGGGEDQRAGNRPLSVAAVFAASMYLTYLSINCHQAYFVLIFSFVVLIASSHKGSSSFATPWLGACAGYASGPSLEVLALYEKRMPPGMYCCRSDGVGHTGSRSASQPSLCACMCICTHIFFWQIFFCKEQISAATSSEPKELWLLVCTGAPCFCSRSVWISCSRFFVLKSCAMWPRRL